MDQRLNVEFLRPEIEFTATRSSKPGGQHVNKVSSKVLLRFDVGNSRLLEEETKVLLLKKWESKLTSDGVLILQSQVHRSQFQNKNAVLLKLDALLKEALKKKKVRKATKPSKSAVKARLKRKRIQSEKKDWRKPPDKP